MRPSRKKSPKQYKPKSRDEIRRNMSAIRSSENQTESALRRSLHTLGFRFRKYGKNLLGKPDLVFPSSPVLVFVDGDYWHARDLVEGTGSALYKRLRRLSPESRRYWRNKFRCRV